MAEIQPVDVDRGELTSLTALRAVAAAGVFLAHIGFAVTATPAGDLHRHLEVVGNTGVPLFFLLSGYLLAQPSSWRAGAGRFLQRRAARILPVYAVAFVGALGLLMVFQSDDPRLTPGTVVLNVLLLQAWSPQGIGASINVPAWSLSVEMFFYAMLPLLLAPFARSVARRPALTGGVVIAALALSTWLYAVGWAWHSLPLLHLPTFFLGCWIARAPHLPRVPVAAGVLGSAVAVVGQVLIDSTNFPPYGLTTMAFGVLVLSLAQADLRRPANRVPRVLVTAGRWSYAFFLLHTLVIFVFNGVISRPPTSLAVGVLLVAAYFAVSWVAAAVTYRVVEEPARRALLRPA